MQRSVITADFEKKETVPPIHRSRFALEKMRKVSLYTSSSSQPAYYPSVSLQAQREKSAGRGWFDLPATQLTPEVKNDLKILKLRNALDPTQHYRANDSKQPPKYFQVRESLPFFLTFLIHSPSLPPASSSLPDWSGDQWSSRVLLQPHPSEAEKEDDRRGTTG